MTSPEEEILKRAKERFQEMTRQAFMRLDSVQGVGPPPYKTKQVTAPLLPEEERRRIWLERHHHQQQHSLQQPPTKRPSTIDVGGEATEEGTEYLMEFF